MSGAHDANDRMLRWLSSSRFNTPDNIPSPLVQDWLDAVHARDTERRSHLHAVAIASHQG